MFIAALPPDLSLFTADQLRQLCCCCSSTGLLCHSQVDLSRLEPLLPLNHAGIWVYVDWNVEHLTQDLLVERVASILDQGARGIILRCSSSTTTATEDDLFSSSALWDRLMERGVGLDRVRLERQLTSSARSFETRDNQFGTRWLFPSNQTKSFWENEFVFDSSILPVLDAQLMMQELDLGRLMASKFLKSDRPDGLFPTVVVDEQHVSLGLVYSSVESLSEAVRTGRGVYYSRSRAGLWRKGESSGATQKLLGVSLDCDSDALQFCVIQDSPGFCHLNRQSCFGEMHGLQDLMRTLEDRVENPVPGSYTNKLFQNAELLHSKIMEEAKELCDAQTKEDVIWEAADVLYFALVKCAQNKVSLSEVISHLAKRSRKVTRRPGLAKDQPRVEASDETSAEVPQSSEVTQSVPDLQLKTYEAAQLSAAEAAKLLQRPIMNTGQIQSRVIPIVEAVRKDGDKAVMEFTKKFDQIELNSPTLQPPFTQYWDGHVSERVQKALDQAFHNVRVFHEAQLHSHSENADISPLEPGCLTVETMPGVVCSRFTRPIEKVGLYVPGGSAVLPSTTLMLGVPALVAQCQSIWIATPPNAEGSVCPEVAYVADKIGAEGILLAGGAQAIAALAYGTESVPSVDKICGPGNQYVTAAKMIVQNDPECLVSIDMPAGPSEVLVIADMSANPAFVASDLLSQAEHGPDSQVVLLTANVSEAKLNAIQTCVREQALALPRCTIVRESLAKSFTIQYSTLEQCLEFSNKYAPEHLILHVEDPRRCIPMIQNAGSVFLGPYSPESCGDYASGTNHTLPTYGYARMYSGVNTNTFLKHITAQEITAEGLNGLGDTVMTLAEIEGLDGHRNAVRVRLDEIRGC